MAWSLPEFGAQELVTLASAIVLGASLGTVANGSAVTVPAVGDLPALWIGVAGVAVFTILYPGALDLLEVSRDE